MNTLCWNCRGMGQPRTVRSLAELVRSNKPQVVGLIETKLEGERIIAIRRKLGFEHCLEVDCRGRSGGLAIWWKDDIHLTVRSYSIFHIDCEIEMEEKSRLTLFYGNPITNRRIETWDLLRRLGHQNSLPWLVLGDFNEVLFGWETEGKRIRGEWQMRRFRETMVDCGLYDLGYNGLPFTFSNRRAGSLEMKARLDRAFGNMEW
ncbi:unnamed protein product [Rhodiola kirilowii]